MAACIGRQKSLTGGGYEARFDPPLSEDFVCAICLMAFREPMQLQCGHQFCRACLEHMRTQFKEIQCPVDRELIDKTRIFPDKSMERKVLSLNVKCHHSHPTPCSDVYEACMWSGELRALEDHLAVCRYKTTKCWNADCGMFVPELYMSDHVTTECEYREWSCSYCTETLLWKQSRDHVTSCPFGPVKCPNGCGEESVPRHLVDEHLKGCVYSVLTCDYFSYGCLFMGTKQERITHEKESVHTHLSMSVQRIHSLEKLLQERALHDETVNTRLELLEAQTNKSKKLLETKLKTKETEERHLQDKIRTLQEKLREMTPTAERLEKDSDNNNNNYNNNNNKSNNNNNSNNDGNYSNANNNNDNSINNMSINNINTSNSDTPSSSNNNGNSNNNNNNNSSTVIGVVREKEVLRPYSIERADTTPIERAYRTMADRQYGVYVWAVDNYTHKLTEARITNGSIYSDPFYSGRSGYKIRLAASLNGQHSGRGTHVGLRIQLMKGQFDSRLLWPFDQKITLMILHQEEESRHVSLTFHPRDLLPDAKEKHFGKPGADINPGRGKGGLLSHGCIDDDSGWTVDDTMYFMCTLHS